MKKIHTLLITSLTSSLLLASPQTQTQMQDVIKLGDQSAKMLGKTLAKNMKEHMKSGGPMDALDFCSNEAYDLTQSVNAKLPKGVEVKRVSNNYRSAVNHPSSNEEVILTALETLQKSGVTLPEYLVETVNEQKFKYYKPLLIDKGVCLKCHGDLKDSKLKEAITARYPNDKAMGYKMNDLRGAIIVTIDKSLK